MLIPANGKDQYFIQLYVVEFVSDMWQICLVFCNKADNYNLIEIL